MTIGCVVMASGEGKRFSLTENKLLADAAGEPLIARTAASVPTDLFDVVVSTRWHEVAEVVSVHGIACALHDGALRGESVRAGLGAGLDRGWTGCLFLPGDQPLVSRESFLALARAHRADPTCIIRLAWQGVPASPVLFPSACFPALMALEGKDGGGSLIRSGAWGIWPIEAAFAHELEDVDTPEDLALLRSRLVPYGS